jgi:hypothetical protein
MAQEAEQTMQMEANHFLRQFQHKGMFHVAKQVIKEICQLQHLETLLK